MQCPLCGQKDTSGVMKLEKYPAYIRPVPKELMDGVPLRELIIDLCESCGLIFQRYPPDKKLLDRIYKINYAAYQSPIESGIGSERTKEYFSFVERSVDFRSIENVLEIGCFDAYLLSLIRDKYPADVVGCDPSIGAEIARKLSIKVIKEYFSPDLFDDRFDLVVLRGLLEHVVGPRGFIGEVRRVMRPGGYIAIEVPDVNYTLENIVVGDFFHEHVTYFSEFTVSQLFESSGFELITLGKPEGYINAIFKYASIGSEGFDVKAMGGEVKRLKGLFDRYNRNVYRFRDELIGIRKSWVEQDLDVFIYGAGGHTLGYLYRVFDVIDVKGILDGDTAKSGKYLPKYNLRVYPKEHVAKICKNSVVIVSSSVYQDEIIDYLSPYMSDGLKIVKLYPKTELVVEKS